MCSEKVRGRKDAPGGADSLDRISLLGRMAPPRIRFAFDELIDGRALRPGEVERVVALIRGEGADEQTRCAAAYVAMKLGIVEALPALKESLSSGTGSVYVKCSFEFTVMWLEMAQRGGMTNPRSGQLMALLKLCSSDEAVERMFAQIVLEKADIKYGTVSSW